jgi:hypothetical protein
MNDEFASQGTPINVGVGLAMGAFYAAFLRGMRPANGPGTMTFERGLSPTGKRGQSPFHRLAQAAGLKADDLARRKPTSRRG